MLFVSNTVKNKALKYKKINVYVDLKYKDKLNLTYRKNDEQISYDYIVRSIKDKFGKKINREWIKIYKVEEAVEAVINYKSVNVLVSTEFRCGNFDVLFDKYFNVMG